MTTALHYAWVVLLDVLGAARDKWLPFLPFGVSVFLVGMQSLRARGNRLWVDVLTMSVALTLLLALLDWACGQNPTVRLFLWLLAMTASCLLARRVK